MKKYYLNKFAPVIKEKENYVFGNNGQFSFGSKKLSLNDNQKKYLELLINGEGIEKDELIKVFGNYNFNYFINNKILITYIQNTDNIYSRSEAFFEMCNIKNAHEKLSEKKVMILGCGGIGTHVSWNLTTLGIGELILVDFDCIEMSNLNRQLLYDTNDLGRLKVEVLKEKLGKVNPNTNIVAVNKNINSENELENVCKQFQSDLIIKSLDSPEQFPKWLDNVSKKLNMKYISGTSTGTFTVVGPTVINNSSYGYSAFFDSSEEHLHVSGMGPSLCTQMYWASSEIATEACKVLLNTNGLKYVNKIHFEDLINGRSMDIYPKGYEVELDEDKKYIWNKNSLLLSMLFPIAAVLSNIEYLIWVGVIFLILSSVCIFSIMKNANIGAFVNVSWYIIVGFIVNIFKNNLFENTDSIGNIVSVLLSVFIIYSLILLITVILTSVLFEIKKIIISLISKRKN